MDNAEQKWLTTFVLPRIAKITGKSCENATLEIRVPQDSFFISAVYFAKIKFGNESISVVIKKPIFLKEAAIEMHSSELFHNEILFYNEVASTSGRYPRCFYSHEDLENPEMSSIVTENVETMGFKLCPEASEIPMKYIIAGVREMAKFHAIGYAMKHNNPTKFYGIVERIQETRYTLGEWNEALVNVVAARPIKYLHKEHYDPEFCVKMEKHLEFAFETIMLEAVKPCEPLAVLCHGDYTRNNIFYRETETGLEAILIDFAMLRYSSPAIDLSTFLYISCSAKNICENFDEIFHAYHDELIDYLREQGIQAVDCYSYDKVLADYKKRAMFGYIIALFFIPLQRGFINVDPTTIGTDQLLTFYQNVMEAGGDQLSKEFANLLINLRSNGCFDHVLSP
ncbi:uncharacterized LOC105268974 [Fopius arisanus]|uniref:Uncharacterized LOC105268974 n=1 Tax=Fopius arisanus TaxID=64838 RepID=A0AAR9IAD3_9HYME|nr:uncharacterized LOC105268974 [Fopius arisanus]KAG8362546.1 EcKinase 18 [Fopius arisanus]